MPSVLGAIKRAVDHDPRPGRFILTGSAMADLVEATWPATGRVVRIPMYGITEREEQPSELPSLLDRLATERLVEPTSARMDLADYLMAALRSGFPYPRLTLSPAGRRGWLEGYVEQLVTRDAASIERRDPDRLRRFLDVLAATSATASTDATLIEAAGVDRRTAVAYEQLLINLFVAERVPSWTANRLKRLTRAPKRALVDATLITAVLRADIPSIVADGTLVGRILETLTVPQRTCGDRCPVAPASPPPGRWPTRDRSDRRAIRGVIALEVKASSSPVAADAKHINWLRDALGDRFLAGAVLHTGPATVDLGPRVVAAPIRSLWS